ncbi:HAUS augmin-like complex subunit 8 [Discoglossus pictus]
MADSGVALLEDGSQNSSGSSGDAVLKKPKAVKVVKSRYMQYDKGKVAKKNVANITVCSAERAPERGSSGTPTRRSMAPPKMKALAGVPSSALDGSLFVKDDLQSTLLEGHRIARPELDLSVINDKTMQRLTPKFPLSAEQRKQKKEAAPLNMVPEEMVEMIESQTLLFTYLAMKMQKNLSRLEEKAERNLLLVTEEKHKLQEKVHMLKQELSLLQREEQVNDLIDEQHGIYIVSRKVEVELWSFRQVLDLSFKVNKEISLQNQKEVEDSCSLEVVRQWYFDGTVS